jgi:hypothetical protein
LINRAFSAPRMKRFSSDPLDNRRGQDSPSTPVYYDEQTKIDAWFNNNESNNKNNKSALFRQLDFGNENNINNANNIMSTRGHTNKNDDNEENENDSFSDATTPNKGRARALSSTAAPPTTPVSGSAPPSTPPMYGQYNPACAPWNPAPGGAIWQRRNSVSSASTNYSTPNAATPSSLRRNYGSPQDSFGAGGYYSANQPHGQHFVSRNIRAYSEPEGHHYGRGGGPGSSGGSSGGMYLSPSGVPPPGFVRGSPTSPRLVPVAPLRPLFLGNTPPAKNATTSSSSLRLNHKAPAWTKQRSITTATTVSGNSYDGCDSRYNSRTAGWSSDEELSGALVGMSVNETTSAVATRDAYYARSNINSNTALGPLPRLHMSDVERLIVRVQVRLYLIINYSI